MSTIAAFSSLYFQHVEPVQESTGWTQSAWTREGRQTWNSTSYHKYVEGQPQICKQIQILKNRPPALQLLGFLSLLLPLGKDLGVLSSSQPECICLLCKVKLSKRFQPLKTNLFFSPLLLLRASLCLFLWSITGVTRRCTLGAANFCFFPS